MASTPTPSAVSSWLKRLLTPDTIGPAECPILYRWTLFPPGMGSNSSSNKGKPVVPDWVPKLLLHHFVPQADERHFHDHPRGFWTFVMQGGYDDLNPCPVCDGPAAREVIGIIRETHPRASFTGCEYCRDNGVVVGEVMRAGMLRWRPAEHEHRTRVHPGGAWTLVLMGPKRREWGFWVDGLLVVWEEYYKQYGFGMRCV